MRTNQQLEDLGYMYVAEQTADDVCKLGDVRVYDKGHVFFVDFDAVLQSFGVENRNHRYYLADNVWKAIQTPKIQALLRDDAWFGEMNHPTQVNKNAPLTPERIQQPWMPNRSHKIMRPRIEGNLLYGHIQTASGTEAGRGFAQEIIQGMVPRFSCRSIATMKNINGKPTVLIKFLITYDWVLYPSHQEAGLVGHLKPVLESGSVVVPEESTSPEDCIVPLREILNLVGSKDVNVQVLMESFDLEMNDLVGIDKTHTHAIIRDRDNTIYANISPETKKRVDDFFSSFHI